MGNVMMLKERQQIIMDLSAAPDNGMESILLQMPAKELLISCALVSKQWHRILASKSFWIEWAELRNYRPEWRRFVGSLSLRSVRHVAIRRPFGRNFVSDAWDTTKFGRAECLVADRRWEFSERIVWTEDETGHRARIEIPPRFIDGPKACPDTGEAVDECVAISYRNFQKRIVIKLADEGLTDEILDKFVPSIVVSELVANRRDCGSVYRVKSQLVKMFPIDVNVHDNKRDKAGRHCCGEERLTVKTFRQWDDEHWHKVEHVFSKYPQGMRYLVVECSGNDTQFWAGNYGPKMAKFRVNALFQFNSD